MLITAIALAAAMQASPSAPEELLGWTVEPPAPVEGRETELDRLSRSPSGAGFLPQLFAGGRSDPRIPVSVTLRALDKITAEFTDLTLPIGESATFGSLTMVARTCSTRPPEEFPETTVFLEVYASDRDVQGQRVREQMAARKASELSALEGVEIFDLETASLPSSGTDDMMSAIPVSEAVTRSIDDALFGEAIFKGWMFASSPSLNAIEHPTYDVWVIACTMQDPDV